MPKPDPKTDAPSRTHSPLAHPASTYASSPLVDPNRSYADVARERTYGQLAQPQPTTDTNQD